MRGAYLGKLHVGGARYFFRERCIERSKVGTWSADAEDCGGDVIFFHHGDMLFWCPFLRIVNWRFLIGECFELSNRYFRPPIWILMAGLDEKLAILGSDSMSMNINTF